MNNAISITYRNIPHDIIQSFPLDKEGLPVNIEHDEDLYFNFTGGPADLVFFISEEYVLTGLMAPAIYDLLKLGIKHTWSNLLSFYKTKGVKVQEDKNYIELNVKFNDGQIIEFNLKGDIDKQLVNQYVEDIFKHFSNRDNIEKYLSDEKLHSPSHVKPRIRMRMNKKTGKWEPVNFGAKRRKQEKMLRDLGKI